MNVGIQEKERLFKQGSWVKKPPPPGAVQNFADGLRAALGLKPLQRHELPFQPKVVSPSRVPRAPVEPLAEVPPPKVAPYVLVDPYGEVILQRRGNARVVKATYRSLDHARRARKRWGGRVWNRRAERFEAAA